MCFVAREYHFATALPLLKEKTGGSGLGVWLVSDSSGGLGHGFCDLNSVKNGFPEVL
jgi:hypothetical protein